MDVIIIGGGVAGLSAAVYLGRFRRQVLVIDGQKPANRFSHAAHGFFTRDGMQPTELLEIGREQLQKYETVQIQNGEVASIVPDGDGFRLALTDGSTYQTQYVLLATGLKDQLPAIDGIEPLWGKSVFTCPFCDGWEQRDQPVAVIANGDAAVHVATLMRELTADLVVCTNAAAEFTDEQSQILRKKGVRVIETPIARLDANGEQLTQIVFTDGSTLARKTAFIRTWLFQSTDIAEQIGCELNEFGMVKVDEMGRTSIARVYAAGDMTGKARQIINASHQGAWAGISINNEIIKDHT